MKSKSKFKLHRDFWAYMIFLVVGLITYQGLKYSDDVSEARENALVEWANGDMNRTLQVKAFNIHCKDGPYKYDCADKHTSMELTSVLISATSTVTKPAPTRWLPNLHKNRRDRTFGKSFRI